LDVRFSDGSVEQYNDTALKAGAEGTIYVSRDQKTVVKIYHSDPGKETDRKARIDNLITRFNPTKQEPYWTQFFTWPEKRVESPGVGYRMRFVTGLKTLDNYIFPKAYSRLPPEEKGWFIGRVATAIKLVTAADRMSRMGLCYPDFAPKNIMVDPFAGHMVLIDCDSLTVPTFLPATIEGTSWYRAPEIVSTQAPTPTVMTDRHALAVLLYQWFLLRHPLAGDRPALDADPMRDDVLRYGEKALYSEHPTNPENRLKDPFMSASVLGQELQLLFQIAFVNGLHRPDLRPLPYQWQKALQHTYDRLIPCTSQYCDWRYFVFNPTARLVCPKCLEAVKNPPTIPLLYLYAQKTTKTPGVYVAAQNSAHHIVGWPQRNLHQWHVNDGATPFYINSKSIPDNNPCAIFAYEQKTNQWYLQNLTLPEMQYRLANDPADRWRPWAMNGSVLLAQDMEILFSHSQSSYRAKIEIHRTQ
jgi:DNA-binding helix-hairpin-helix protein with protein kinase domain